MNDCGVVQTRVLFAKEKNQLGAKDLQTVLETLERDEPVALPTETVYGLAANALSVQACIKIFAAKQRPLSDPLIVHVPHLDWLAEFTDADPRAQILATRFWPGPLTMVLRKRPSIPDAITAGHPTVAVRQSAHPVMQQIISAFGKGLAAPSANRFGHVSPTTAAHVLAELGGRIPLIVDGGSCAHGIESTIVQLVEKGFRILRKGPVSASAIADALGQPEMHLARSGAQTPAPGNLPWHYAPSTPLLLFRDTPPADAPKNAAVLAWSIIPSGEWKASIALTPDGSASRAAMRFYAALRELDEVGASVIYAQLPPGNAGAESFLCEAIADRLHKAAARFATLSLS
jgi:L-threonylcarbamoyladenylate synthase